MKFIKIYPENLQIYVVLARGFWLLEEFDKSKLKWNGESMKYGDDYLSDEGNIKPNSDVEICIS